MHVSVSATRRVAILTASAGLALALAGCGSSTAESTAATTAAGTPLVLDDGWVKAVDGSATPSGGGMSPAAPTPSGTAAPMEEMPEMEPMTAMFGTLRNSSDRPVTVTGGSSPAAGRIELHETVPRAAGAMQMQEKRGGFVVPPGGSFTLEPGADHVMLMELAGSLENGATTTVSLTTSAGEVTFTVPVRAFSGAEESYEPSPSPS
ncbi:MAG: copper chaperone PCu(A)C [Dermatophilaceae bacterium]